MIDEASTGIKKEAPIDNEYPLTSSKNNEEESMKHHRKEVIIEKNLKTLHQDMFRKKTSRISNSRR